MKKLKLLHLMTSARPLMVNMMALFIFQEIIFDKNDNRISHLASWTKLSTQDSALS